MALIYVIPSTALKNGAVTEKVLNQIRSFNRNGVECRGLFFSTSIEREYQFDSKVMAIPLPNAKTKWFRSIIQNYLTHKTIKRYLAKNLLPQDVLYIRFSSSGRQLYRLSLLFKNRIIFEFQTKDIEEIKLDKKKFRRFFDLSALLTNIEGYYLPLLFDWIFGSRIRKNSLCIVGVTEEICSYQKNRYNVRKPAFLLSNSIDVNTFNPRSFTPQEFIILLFLRGASTAASYHGLDKLINGMARANEKDRSMIKVICAGNNFEVEELLVKNLSLTENFTFLNYLDKEELNHYFNLADLGIGSLALHRISLLEGSVLKIREYFARGLPFIYGYNDTDISGNSCLESYCLKFRADEMPLDIESIINFSKKMRANPSHPGIMHQYAKLYLDFDVKTAKLLDELSNYEINLIKK